MTLYTPAMWSTVISGSDGRTELRLIDRTNMSNSTVTNMCHIVRNAINLNQNEDFNDV